MTDLSDSAKAVMKAFEGMPDSVFFEVRDHINAMVAARAGRMQQTSVGYSDAFPPVWRHPAPHAAAAPVPTGWKTMCICGAWVEAGQVHVCRPPASRPAGCICPPGSNATCQAPLCPRRGLPAMGAGT